MKKSILLMLFFIITYQIYLYSYTWEMGLRVYDGNGNAMATHVELYIYNGFVYEPYRSGDTYDFKGIRETNGACDINDSNTSDPIWAPIREVIRMH